MTRQHLRSDGIPTRNDMRYMTPAELAILEVVQTVEGLGASPVLTKATVLLSHARDLVADHVEGKKEVSAHDPNCTVNNLCLQCAYEGQKTMRKFAELRAEELEEELRALKAKVQEPVHLGMNKKEKRALAKMLQHMKSDLMPNPNSDYYHHHRFGEAIEEFLED
jgi:hypothetical protein